MPIALTVLNYPLDESKINSVAARAYIEADPYYDSRYDKSLDTWLISRYNDPYIKQIMDDLNIDAKPRFYWTEPNSVIPEHVDNGTTCSVNFVLSPDPAPVSFGENEFTYTQCLLNTTLPHAVYNNSTERILLKLSIFDTPFEQVLDNIPDKYKGGSIRI